ncbi:MAG TPA: glycosyltransferase family 39 protein [Chloroflexota bacterium]|nr:glycosyltransferase family 39 protein [Chloroflexota bacterium]
MATEQSAPLGRQASVQTAAAVGAWPPTHEPPAGPPALAEPAIAAPSTNGRARGRRGLLARAVGSPGGDAAVLFALALGMRLPYQTNTLYHWDSVLYARALAAFDVSESQPHPPGYLFYVGAARLAQLALGDANASLVAVSLLGGALAVLLTYVVGRQLFGRGAGIAAALLLATAPPFWLYSGVAYPYTVLASGSLALAGLTVAYWRGRWRHPLWLGLLYGLAGGFRTDLLLFLAPLLAAAHLVCWRRDRRLGTLLAPLPGAALGTLAWLVPTAGLSQGWAVYGPLLWHQGAYVEGSYSLWSHGWRAFQSNSWQVWGYAQEGLGLALAPLAYGIGRGGWRWWRGGRPRPHWSRPTPALVLVLWLAPPILFYALVHIGDRGYSFSYLPGLCIVAGAGLRLFARDAVRLAHASRARLIAVGGWRVARWLTARRLAAPLKSQSVLLAGDGRCPATAAARGRRPARARLVYAALLALLLGANLQSFLLGRSRLSAYEVDCLNRGVPEALAIVRRDFDPADTLIFASFFYQQARYYLPEYRAWWFDPLTRPVFREAAPAGVRRVLLWGDSIRPASQPNGGSYPLPCGRRLYYFFNVEPGAQLVFRPPLLSVRSTP